ncbi:MAG: hypothetical protein DMG26_13265, partial [Acidobacteria bacterium]
NESFNHITVDGDTSTNDTVLALASGASGVTVRAGAKSASWFAAGLVELCQTLAKLIVKDGEGASKLVAVEVRGAKTAADADRVARAIANSPLVKTALAGSDPNWGRILCAAGYSGASFDPAKVDILVNDFFLCRAGVDAGPETPDDSDRPPPGQSLRAHLDLRPDARLHHHQRVVSNMRKGSADIIGKTCQGSSAISGTSAWCRCCSKGCSGSSTVAMTPPAWR